MTSRSALRLFGLCDRRVVLDLPSTPQLKCILDPKCIAMSYQKVGQDEVNAGVPGSTDGVVASDTATVDVTVEKDTPEALLTFFGVTVCLNQPAWAARRVLGPPHGCYLRVPSHRRARGPNARANGRGGTCLSLAWERYARERSARRGGIVFFPFLVYFGVAGTFNAVAFGVSTQMLGNGTFGFLNWLKRDPSRIVYALCRTKFCPSSARRSRLWSSSCGRKAIKFMFGLFSLSGRVVLYASANGACMRSLPPIMAHQHRGAGAGTRCARTARQLGCRHGRLGRGGLDRGKHWHRNAIVTFVSLTVVLGVDSHQAVPSSIIAGGWTSAYNGLIHLLWLRDVPIHLWLIFCPVCSVRVCGAARAHSNGHGSHARHLWRVPHTQRAAHAVCLAVIYAVNTHTQPTMRRSAHCVTGLRASTRNRAEFGTVWLVRAYYM